MSGTKQIDGYKIYMAKLLGKGSYGAVYIGSSDKNGEEVAVKILKKNSIDSDDYLKSALFNQIKIMQTVKSDNIVGFYDVMQSSNNYYIVQQLCDGDLSSIVKPGKKIPQNDARQYLLQISNGFLALIKQGIIHRDLKPANVMKKGNILKIGDFGFAKKTQTKGVQNQTIVGTPLYMSLQILKSQAYSSKCDIWALGFIFYEMLHGKTPWMGKSQYDLIKKIQTKPLQIDPALSDQTKDFLQKCLKLEEQDRISWDQLYVHPIFDGYFVQNANDKKQFQNKLKTIMADLRFQIHSQNLDLCRIMAGLGYKDANSEMDKSQYFQFLKIIYPTLTRKESDYIFQKTDEDQNGSISIKQIQNLMIGHGIGLTSVWKSLPGIQQKNSLGQEYLKLSEQTQKKVRGCFVKLLRILQMKNLILQEVFIRFDKGKSGDLTRSQFKTLIFQITSELQEDQINGAFDLIDTDHSNAIDFEELNKYFSKVNGIPQHLNRKPQKKPQYQQPKSFHRLFNQYSNNQQPQYQPQQQYYNPYQPMYQQPQQQYQYQQPQQQQGRFDNFIMNQLSNNVNQSHQQWQKK